MTEIRGRKCDEKQKSLFSWLQYHAEDPLFGILQNHPLSAPEIMLKGQKSLPPSET